MKNKEEIIERIKNIKSELESKFEVVEIGIFGSYVRNEAKNDSDLDVLISLKQEHNVGLIKFNSLKEFLSDLLNIKVDLVLKDSLKPALKKKYIARGYVFMKRSVKHFLEDAIEYCEKAQKFTDGITYEEFSTDEKTFMAVTRALEIIGEALKNLPDNFKNKYQGVPWREIIGFRNTVAHAYFGINTKIVWNSAKEDTKYLKSLLSEIIKTIN